MTDSARQQLMARLEQWAAEAESTRYGDQGLRLKMESAVTLTREAIAALASSAEPGPVVDMNAASVYYREGWAAGYECARRTQPSPAPTPGVEPDLDYAPYWLVALRACDEALAKHNLWCGYRRGSPGDPSFNRAERLIRDAIRRADFEAKSGTNSLQKPARKRDTP